jgi:uncharacterized membrane protein YedE/YeeE
VETFTPVSSLLGGVLIGIAASILLLFHGRVAGIAGIVGETLRGEGTRGEGVYRGAFLFGLLLSGLVLRFVYPSAFGAAGTTPAVGLVLVAVAGVLVGYGTRLGNGCTSGHGVCGMSRLSRRSAMATVTFMAAGAATVFVVRHVLGVGQ